ncbi:MAG TPA: glutamate--cysteine ligase [Ruminiclostridium sp.]|nr:glutamate--cysteine ligase [Ruminiclostridium sp.]
MNWKFEKVLDIIRKTDSSLLLKGKWGIEREAQRVTKSGNLALTDHPAVFGNKLLNSEITTDFSESQLELITPPLSSAEEVYKYLELLTLKVNDKLKDELLWPLSMPPILPLEEKIPIAKFDDTPEGREKKIYRLGLANRYGKKMQMISGIHFNLSFSEELIDVLHKHFGKGEGRSEFTDRVYFAMARNFLRYRWLLIYLFGASPSADQTFNSVIHNEIKTIRKCCPECCNPLSNYKKYATSLRVSRFGYSNDEQGRFAVLYNNKSEYLRSIRKMLNTKSKKYSKIGTFKDGKQVQLNENILQKDSEFYSAIRLKQVTEKGESQLEALEKRGVRYAEVRIIDINPFEGTGISLEQMYFLQVFMLLCLFEKSCYINKEELNLINKNHNLIAISGRKDKLLLYRYKMGRVSLEEWGQNIFGKLFRIARAMDTAGNSSKYTECVFNEFIKLTDKSLLPSNRITNEMKINGDTFITFGVRKALEYKSQNKKEGELKNVEGL